MQIVQFAEFYLDALAIRADRQDECGTEAFDHLLYIVHIEDKRPQRFSTSPANEVVPRWSRDGNWIYFASDQDSTWQIWKKPITGGEAIRMTHTGGFEAQESEDGTRLYYTKPGRPGIWERTIKNGRETHLLQDLIADPWGNWGVWGNHLFVLDHTEDHRFPLIRYDLDTRRVTWSRELDSAPDNLGFTISPDGQSIVYTRQDRTESDLLLLQNF